MKKTLLKIFALCMVVCSTLFVFTACGESPISFKLNFVVDNEIVKTIDTTGNERISLPNDPQKDGYTFDGWFWDKDVWETPFTANSLLDAPLSSDMSVYAKFTKNHEHNYTATVTAPTCTEKGYTTYTCACGYSYEDNYTNALEHEFTNYVYDNIQENFNDEYQYLRYNDRVFIENRTFNYWQIECYNKTISDGKWQILSKQIIALLKEEGFEDISEMLNYDTSSLHKIAEIYGKVFKQQNPTSIIMKHYPILGGIGIYPNYSCKLRHWHNYYEKCCLCN